MADMIARAFYGDTIAWALMVDDPAYP